jgi:hypothetical protein
MGWARHIACMEIKSMHIGFWWENHKEKRPLRIPRSKWIIS